MRISDTVAEKMLLGIVSFVIRLKPIARLLLSLIPLVILLFAVQVDMRWLRSSNSLVGMNVYRREDNALHGKIIKVEMNYLNPPDYIYDAAIVDLHVKKPRVLNDEGVTLIAGAETQAIPIFRIGRFGAMSKGGYNGRFYFPYEYYTKVPFKTWVLWVLTLLNILWLLWCSVPSLQKKVVTQEY